MRCPLCRSQRSRLAASLISSKPPSASSCCRASAGLFRHTSALTMAWAALSYTTVAESPGRMSATAASCSSTATRTVAAIGSVRGVSRNAIVIEFASRSMASIRTAIGFWARTCPAGRRKTVRKSAMATLKTAITLTFDAFGNACDANNHPTSIPVSRSDRSLLELDE